MPIPTELERAVTALGDVYRRVEADINAELAQIIDQPNQGARVRRLRALAAETDRRSRGLEDEARAFLNNSLPSAWQAGAVKPAVGQFTWTQAHRQGLGLLAQDTFAEVLGPTRHMSRDIKTLVRELGKKQATSKVATGQPVKAAGRELARDLKSRGISAITYADGRNIRASTYAEMLMRTKTAVAFNMGNVNQLVQVGIRYVEGVDGGDCGLVTHTDGLKVNGRVFPVDVAGAYAIAHPNAVMAGSVVETIGGLRASYRARWSGPVVRIRTAGGSRLAVGPNHPVLTHRGWLKACHLSNGDHVLRRTGHRPIAVPGVVGDVHLNQMPARVEDVHAALGERGTLTRVVPAPDDLHGDGNFCEGEVEVVVAERSLTFVAHPSGVQLDGESVLVRGRAGAGGSGERTSALDVLTVDLAPASGVGRRHVRGIGVATSDLDVALPQTFTNGRVGAAEQVGQLLGAGAGEVLLDEIIDVHQDTGNTHAFDLETGSGVYWCDGILVHNCRRDWVARPDVTSDEGAAVATSWRSPEQIADQVNFEKYLRAQAPRSSGRAPRQARQARTSRGTLTS